MKRMIRKLVLILMIFTLLIHPSLSNLKLAHVNANDQVIEISSAKELQAIDDLTGNYILTNDIDLSELKEWRPLGSATNYFSGSFLGMEYKIKNMDIAYQDMQTEGVFYGLTEDAEYSLVVEYSESEIEENQAVQEEEIKEAQVLAKDQEDESDLEKEDEKSIDEAEKEVEKSIDKAEKEVGKVESKENKAEKKLEKTRSKEVSVSRAEDFVEAANDTNIRKITLLKDIDISFRYSIEVDRSLEIDLGGYRLDLNRDAIELIAPKAPDDNLIHIHNGEILNNESTWGLVQPTNGRGTTKYSYAREWKFRFGNLSVPKAHRLAVATRAEVTVYGKMDVHTKGENFYVGSMIFEPNTIYRGDIYHYNYSTIWFIHKSEPGDTGESREFTVGEGANIRISKSSRGTTYPAVFNWFDKMTINEGAVFNASMPGNALRFDAEDASFTAKKNAVVNLTSTSTSGSVVQFSAPKTRLVIEEGAYFYVIGRSSDALVEFAQSNGGLHSSDGHADETQLILNKPAQFDIRNLDDGRNSTAIGYGTRGYNHKFTIKHSDIDLWEMDSDVLGPSSNTYALVDAFETITDRRGYNEKVISSNPDLQSTFSYSKFRRIAGMNQQPEVEFEEVTDAQKTIKARVKIGEVPDNAGSNEAGEVNYIPVYASKDQANVQMTDSETEDLYELSTDREGYVTYVRKDFYQAGTRIKGKASRGAHLGEVSEVKVSDVTPPEPAIIDKEVSERSKTLTGSQAEPNAKVTLTVNDKEVNLSTRVNEEGNWLLPIKELDLVGGDILQIFLEDEFGNKNPKEDTKHQDALFKAATQSVVLEGVLEFVSAPESLNFKAKISSKHESFFVELGSEASPLLIVDERQNKQDWQLQAKMTKQLMTVDKKHELRDSIIYRNNQKETVLKDDYDVVYHHAYTEETKEQDQHNLSKEWSKEGNGLFLDVLPGEAVKESYQGEISWVLIDAP